jgi:hypothetical protein
MRGVNGAIVSILGAAAPVRYGIRTPTDFEVALWAPFC